MDKLGVFHANSITKVRKYIIVLPYILTLLWNIVCQIKYFVVSNTN